MAMRPRGRSDATPSPKRTRLGGVWPVFEDFKPKSEWKEDDESHILVIYLPGFMKEQIRVSTEGRNIIRVRGERLVSGYKWSRFLEDFQVPKNCELNLVRARFQKGTLNITVPKKSVDKSQEALPPKTTTDAQKQATPQKGQDKVLPPVGATQPTDIKSTAPQKMSDDPRKKVGQDDVPRYRKSITPFRDAGRAILQDAERKESSELEKKHIASERADEVIKKVEIEEKNSERSKELPEDETARKMKLKKDDGAAAISQATEMDKASKGKHIIHLSGADYGAFTAGKYKKAVKGLGQLNGERQLLVNMGVAVLIIVALSAYATYKFASGKEKS